MASETLNEYERQRLENIRRNDEMMASLFLRSKASALSEAAKRSKTPNSTAADKEKKKPQLIPVRRSLRHRGLPPDSQPSHNAPPPPDSPIAVPSPKPKRLRLSDAFVEGPDSSDSYLIQMILDASKGQCSDFGKGGEGGGELLDPSDLVLRPQNARKILEGRILALQFLPFGDRTVVVAGDTLGQLGFCDFDCMEEEGDGALVYAPHAHPLTEISVHPLSPTKIFTCSCDGFIRLMDIQRGTFNVAYSTDNDIYSVCQSPSNVNSFYFGEGPGELKLWDERIGKVSSTWNLHKKRINTINFHPKNANLMATSSTDRLACIWDLRNMKKGAESLKSIRHKRAVHAAYFSPSGSCLATTSPDDKVGILSGVNFNDLFMIQHYNPTGRWTSPFRAIWGWDDSYLLIGNMKRAVDVISVAQKTTTSLESELMTSIPSRFAVHPYKRGSLACATSTGKIYLWTKS